jgi:hypothetical protein
MFGPLVLGKLLERVLTFFFLPSSPRTLIMPAVNRKKRTATLFAQ